jgi:hypothetical protein
MTRNPSKLYAQHVANLRELELAIGHSERMAKSAIASKDPQNSLRSLLRLYSFLIGAWAETRLKKLLHEEFGFDAAERLLIETESAQLDEWKKCIEVAYRKHFGISRAPLDQNSLGVAEYARYHALNDSLENELRIIIEIRNKLAHGQWVYPFTNDGSKVEADKYRLINQENLLSLKFKFSLIGHLADLVHDLVVSPSTFQRDFEGHFRKLLQVRINIQKKDYEAYKNSLVASRQAARQSRRSTI